MSNELFESVAKGKLIPFSKAAKMLGVVPSALRNRTKAGTITAVKVAGRWLVPIEEVEAEMKNRTVKAGRPKKSEG